MIDFYVIYKEGDRACEEYVRECQMSAEYYGINTILFPGVYSRVAEIREEESLPLGTTKQHVVDSEPKQANCISHYFLWKKCVALNKPIGVFEYDAVVVRPLPANILDTFDDYLNLDINRHYHNERSEGYYEDVLTPSEFEVHAFKGTSTNQKPKYVASIKYMFRAMIYGAHAYIIKPEAAKKLIHAAKTDGILPADMLLSLRYVNLQYTLPSLACVNPRMWHSSKEQSHSINSKID